jgi:hypothetical protein
MLFSVGAGGGGTGDVVVGVVVVVVVVEVSGAFCSSLAQDAVKPTIATIAAPPATAERRRTVSFAFIFIPIVLTRYLLILAPGPSLRTEFRESAIIAQLINVVRKFAKFR